MLSNIVTIFTVFVNIIIIIFLRGKGGGGRMSRICKVALKLNSFYVCTVIVICCLFCSDHF